MPRQVTLPRGYSPPASGNCRVTLYWPMPNSMPGSPMKLKIMTAPAVSATTVRMIIWMMVLRLRWRWRIYGP